MSFRNIFLNLEQFDPKLYLIVPDSPNWKNELVQATTIEGVERAVEILWNTDFKRIRVLGPTEQITGSEDLMCFKIIATLVR